MEHLLVYLLIGFVLGVNSVANPHLEGLGIKLSLLIILAFTLLWPILVILGVIWLIKKPRNQ